MTAAVDTRVGSVLEASGWGWRHSGRQAWAVRDVDLRIEPGSRVLLLGASGSGKSTLLHGMAGLLSAEEGESTGSLTLGGSPASSATARALVGLVQQDPDSQVVMERIGDEVAFGCENLGLPHKEIWCRVIQSLKMVGLDLPLNHPTEELSGGQKQRLALAASLAMRPKLLLLDEPTANLDPTGVTLIREAVERVASEAPETTLVIIEHRVDTWLDLIDRVIVLDDGQILADGAPEEILASQAEVLLEAGIWVPGRELPVAGLAGAEPSEVVLRTEGLSVGYRPDTPIRTGLDLHFEQGQSTCIIGSNGSGKTTLALTMAGLLKPLTGRVSMGSGSPTDWSSVQLLGRIAMVFQEPSYQFLTSTVADELAFGLRQSGLSEAKQQERVDDFLERMRLTPLARAHPLSLSGGEKRRLSVASALISAPQVLILDEPTFGQDRNTWISLVEILQHLVRQGTTVISITHDDTFVRTVGQRIINLDGTGLPPRVETPVAQVARAAAIERVNPVFRLIGLALMTLPMFVTVDVLSAAVALGLELLLLPLAGFGPRKLLRRIWPLLAAAPMAAISMVLYAKPGGEVYWSLGPAVITQNSVELSLAIALRVLAIGLPGIVILTGARPTEMADALTQVGKLPARPVFATLAGIRLAALMLEDWQALQRARRSRGVAEGSRFVGFFRGIFALFTFALRRAGTLSITMEARGFGAPVARSYARTSRTGPADAVMLIVSALVPTAAISAAVIAGTFRWFGM